MCTKALGNDTIAALRKKEARLRNIHIDSDLPGKLHTMEISHCQNIQCFNFTWAREPCMKRRYTWRPFSKLQSDLEAQRDPVQFRHSLKCILPQLAKRPSLNMRPGSEKNTLTHVLIHFLSFPSKYELHMDGALMCLLLLHSWCPGWGTQLVLNVCLKWENRLHLLLRSTHETGQGGRDSYLGRSSGATMSEEP